jgi:hypothetical protein
MNDQEGLGAPDGRQQKFTPVEFEHTKPELVVEPEVNRGLAEPNLMQQDKMLQSLVTGNSVVLSMGHFELEQNTRERFTADLTRRQLTPELVSGFLQTIKPPAQYEEDPAHPVTIYDQVQTEPQQKAIIAFASGVQLRDRDTVEDADLGQLLVKYPDPVVFERQVVAPMRAMLISNKNTPEKLAEYEQSTLAFQRTVYGKRQEYWEQFQLLFGNTTEMDEAWAKAA